MSERNINIYGANWCSDCRKGSVKQAIASAGEGATAALMMRSYLEVN